MIDLVGIGREKLRSYEVRSLIYYSEYVKEEFPTLFEFVQEHISNVRAIDLDLIEQLPEQDLRIIDNIFSEIIIRCKNEWEGSPVPYEELEGSNSIPCSLCNAATKKVYYIKNKVSNKIVNVGSTCIDQFLIDEKLAGKSKAQLRRDGEKAKRLTVINDRFPGIKRRLEKWNDELSDHDVLIPNIFAIPYQDLGNELMEAFQSFINNNCGEEVFEQIEQGLSDQHKFVEEFKKYTLEHINDKYIVTKKMVKWLLNHGDIKTLESLKESGYVTYSNAPYIHEPEFILKMVQEISPFFEEQHITILGTDQDERGVILRPLKGTDISFICKFKVFFDVFGWIIFGEKQKAAVSTFNVVYVSEPYNQRSLDNLVAMMKEELDNHIVKIDTRFYYEQDHELDLLDTRTEKYLSVNRREFIKKFKTVLVKPAIKDQITVYVDDLVKQGHKTLTWEDLLELRDQTKQFKR